MADWTGATYQDKRYTSTCGLLAALGVSLLQSFFPSVLPAFMCQGRPVITGTAQQDGPFTLGSVLYPWESSVGLSLSLGLTLGFRSYNGGLEGGGRHAGVKQEYQFRHQVLVKAAGERKGQSIRVFFLELWCFIRRQVLLTVWRWQPIRLFPRGG